ncbi:MAG: hypothetical protein PVI90_01235 [Desulfobacteraceae bacterium]|jgi:hypothetical protein
MNLKFWQRKKPGIGGGAGVKIKLRPPKEPPQPIGQYLVTREKIDPDLAWSYKCVLKSRTDNKHRFDFRVFSESMCSRSGIVVKNYDSLEEHQNLILYHGWYDKHTNEVNMIKGENN